MRERMSPVLSPEGRVAFLFGQIRNHATAEEAYTALDQYQISLREKRKSDRGEKSEINVMRALVELPLVESVIRSEKFSIEDMRGVDLTVLLLDEPVESVGVQVKSHDEEVRIFRDFGSQSGQYRQDGAEILARRGLIALNGKTSADQIQENFMNGLQKIRNMHMPTEVA